MKAFAVIRFQNYNYETKQQSHLRLVYRMIILTAGTAYVSL